ncbi:MAG: peptidylprolyl isomerase [Verrucomicrobiota bacterium]
MIHRLPPLACVALALAALSCKPAPKKEPVPEEAGLVRVGSEVITQADLDYQLQEKHGGRSDEATRSQALAELTERARFSQAARDAGLDRDPVARAEIARMLASRLRETALDPKLKEAAMPVPETRLRELYQSHLAKFQSPEKRQVAVLWLNPGANPERLKQYQEKLDQAREWFFSQSELVKQPDQGFSTLSVDYSEHAATRFQGGVLGWIEAEGTGTGWTREVARIAFSLNEVGEVSPVTTGPEGVFLVRSMAMKPAMTGSYESVRSQLEREEQARVKKQREQEFQQEIQSKYPAVVK